MSNRRLVLVVVCLLLLIPLPLSAQSYIFGRADLAVGNVPAMIAQGDFDGDGEIDLAVTNSNDNTVSILLGRSGGAFAPQITYATGPEPLGIVAADFNGDGKLDLAITNGNCTDPYYISCSASTVSILLGNGDGTFRSHVDYPVGTRPTSVIAADFNGDGKLDLAVANAVDATISILLGNGDGTFRTEVAYPTGIFFKTGWQTVTGGDFNGDGKLDLAVSGNGYVSVLLGKGNGTFGSPVETLASTIASISVQAAGDFNHDGKLDLAVLNDALGGLVVLLGNGDGTFTPYASYSGGGDYIAVADLNGDGKPDLVTSSTALSYAVSVWLGNGDGTFKPRADYGTGNSSLGLVVADINGDGKPDLAVVDSGCEVAQTGICSGQQAPPFTVSVLLGVGNGRFVARTDYPTGAAGGMVTSADLNRDGRLDLATNTGSNSISVLLGNGNGTFGKPHAFSTGPLPSWVAAGDLRTNGVVDLVSANETCTTPTCTPGTVSVLLGNGDGTFQKHADYGVELLPYSVTLGDFRGNGKLDLAVANNGSGTVSILLGNGDGTFQRQVSYTTGIFPRQVATGDFNGDGKLDLAVTTSSGVSVLLGNGDGTFKTHDDYPTNGGISIAVADFNGDGHLDLAIGSGGVAILLGKGDGTFQAPVTYPANQLTSVYSLAVADFNKDGKLDLAANGYGSGGNASEASILLGNGDGTFQTGVPYLLGNTFSMSLTVGDFNGDGIPDWAAVDSLAKTVGVMLGVPGPGLTKTTSALRSSLNPSSYGQAVTFTATVSSGGKGTPTGDVTFYDGSTSLGAVGLAKGAAGITVSKLSAGTHSITAAYGGDTTFAASTSTALMQRVNKGSVSIILGSSSNPSRVGQSVKFTSIVGGSGTTPTGSVTFKNGSAVLATVPLASGQAICTTSFSKTGTFSITAEYLGDQNYQAKTSKVLKQVVTK